MKVWLSASEIAALTLPGLPSTKRKINAMAERLGWNHRSDFARPRVGRGGGFEYHFHLLPSAARAAYVAHHVEMVELPTSVAREAASEPQAEHLGGAATEARDARLALLIAADRTASQGQLSRKVADRQFADLYNSGRVEVASWIKAEVKSLTPRTLARWSARIANVKKVGQAWATGSVGPAPVPAHEQNGNARAYASNVAQPFFDAGTATKGAAGGGTLAGVMSQAQTQLEPFVGTSDFVTKIYMGLTVAGLVVAVGGAVYAIYADWRTKKAQRAIDGDVLADVPEGQFA